MTRLTTHVLDTAAGLPAAGLRGTLWRCTADHRERIVDFVTNGDGRVDAPLLDGAAFVCGIYELSFEVSAYYTARGVALPDPPFLDVVSLRFGIADLSAKYHVPLLLSPWSYSTYRGS